MFVSMIVSDVVEDNIVVTQIVLFRFLYILL
jgi:hypothetical protein